MSDRVVGVLFIVLAVVVSVVAPVAVAVYGPRDFSEPPALLYNIDGVKVYRFREQNGYYQYYAVKGDSVSMGRR